MIESIKYIPCPVCCGRGWNIEGRLYPSGHTEEQVQCEFCEGEGQFEESDYLIMKLEGRV
jgi:hypothetical protein